MKKILAITLITLGVLIAGGYATYTYAEDTQAYTTQDNQPTTLAWGIGEVTPYHAECGGPWVATMTHTFRYGQEPCIIVDIEDTHLEWDSRPLPGDYMINWTNIYARACAMGSFKLNITASDCAHIQRSDGATITTGYALVTPGGAHPSPANFTQAPDFNGPLSGTPVQGSNGYPVRYDKDLWARVIPNEENPAGTYEDVFYLTFAVSQP